MLQQVYVGDKITYCVHLVTSQGFIWQTWKIPSKHIIYVKKCEDKSRKEKHDTGTMDVHIQFFYV